MDDIRKCVLKTTGFELPAAYLCLLENGCLRLGESREDWQENWLTICTTAPPALMCSPWHMAVEWFTTEQILDWSPPGYWKPNRFVPFAGNGYGDQWVWDPDRTHVNGTPVVLCRHDENKSEIMAGSFSDFLFRILLEGFAHVSYDDRDEFGLDDIEFKQCLDLNIQTVGSHLKKKHQAVLKNILKNEFKDNIGEEHLFLISEHQKMEILKLELPSGNVGLTFEHMIR